MNEDQEHKYTPLTQEDYELLRSVRANGGRINMNLLQRSIDELLRLRDTMERLRNLHSKDVTEEQRMKWLHSWSYGNSLPRLHRDMISAAVRMMLKDV